MEISEFRLKVFSAELLAPTVEETMHILDRNTPKDIEYDELIPRSFSLTFEELTIQLKDAKLPLIHISESEIDDVPAFTCSGLIIISEQICDAESYRTVVIPMTPIDTQAFVVKRMINPTKIYTKLNTVIQSRNDVRFNWGLALEPFMSDFVSVLDTFTLSNVDPSHAIGWWDKFRLIFHGQNTLEFLQGGLRIRMTGSTSPYYDPRLHYGSEGLEFCFSKKVNVSFGMPCPLIQSSNVQQVVVTAGQLLLAAPLNNGNSGSIKEEIIVKLTGSIKSNMKITFLSNVDVEKKNHTDIVLRDPSYVRDKVL